MTKRELEAECDAMAELLEDLCCYLKREGITLPDDMQKDLDQFAVEDDEMNADVIEIEPE